VKYFFVRREPVLFIPCAGEYVVVGTATEIKNKYW
jgi:hypothetical protein